MSVLEQFFTEEKLDFNNLIEEDIIMLLEKVFRSKVEKFSKKDKTFISNSILEVVKKHKYDGNKKNNNGEILLSYALNPESTKLATYLLNHCYDLTNFDYLINSIISLKIIEINNIKLRAYFIKKKNLHPMYKENLIVMLYRQREMMDLYMIDKYKEKMEKNVESIEKLMTKETCFSHILLNVLETRYPNQSVFPLEHLLKNHPLDIDEKIRICDNYINNVPNVVKVISFKEHEEIVYNKFRNYYIFSKKLLDKDKVSTIQKI